MLLDTTVDHLASRKSQVSFKTIPSGKTFYHASLFPLFAMVLCYFIGLFSGEYTDMVTIPAGRGARIGIPLLLYGSSPAAISLLIVTIVSFLLFILLVFLGNYSDNDKK